MCWLNDLLMPLVKHSVHQKYDLQKNWEIWCAWSKEILTQNMSSSSIAAITSVALRLQQGEEVGRVARIPPPTKLVAAQFRIVLATPRTCLSMFQTTNAQLLVACPKDRRGTRTFPGVAEACAARQVTSEKPENELKVAEAWATRQVST